MAKLRKTEDIIKNKETLRMMTKIILNSTYGIGNPKYTMAGFSSLSEIRENMFSLDRQIRELRESSD